MLRFAALALLLVIAAPERASADAAPVSPDADITSFYTDWQTGFALRGFDPVAYFTQGQPVEGRADFEVSWNGTTWRFANRGNQMAFVAAPHVYAPVSGGFDAEMALRGKVADSNPLVFTIKAGRLHLFRSRKTRDAHASRLDTVAR